MSGASATPASTHTPRRAAERIREAAAKLFYRNGIRAVGVEQIVSDAGVTKPSLYRAYASKDALVAEYLRDYEQAFWCVFEASSDDHPNDPRAQLLAYFEGLALRASRSGYRGCALTNAAIEYPDLDHPARQVAVDHKRALRTRLKAMSQAMGARDPAQLADALLLLLEGSYASGQTFGPGGPVKVLVATATCLIDAAVRS